MITIKCLLIMISWCFLSANEQFDTFMNLQENAQGIPANLLRAIANVESGRSISGLVTPWPWTINVEGKGYIFKTKLEAIKAVQKFQFKGVKSIDVGLMQINLYHHPYAFSNLEEAFDPQLNIAYGAKFLKQLFQQHKSWNKAVGYYHSATPKFHNVYKQKVLNNWMQLSKNAKLPSNSTLAQTILRFDDLAKVDFKDSKAAPQTFLPTFAKIKRVYYALDGSSHTLSKPVTVKKVRHQLETTSNRQFYSLD